MPTASPQPTGALSATKANPNLCGRKASRLERRHPGYGDCAAKTPEVSGASDMRRKTYRLPMTKLPPVLILTASLLPTVAVAQVSLYSEDFEALQAADPLALSGSGWIAYGNVFDPGGSLINGYGPFPAPNSGSGFSEIRSNLGTPAQGAQHLLVLSDYGNLNHVGGNLVEANVYQERTIDQASAGKTVDFEFDARTLDLQSPSTALAFIKVIDAQTFAVNDVVTADMSSLASSWSTYSMNLVIDPSHVGDLLQFGFASTATNFVPSGVLYDNVRFEKRASSAVPTSPAAPQAPRLVQEWELPALPPSAPGNTCSGGEPTFQGASTSSPLDRMETVLLHNGEFTWAETDLEWWFTAGDRMGWRRRYRSRLGRPTPMGLNWDHSWNIFLAPLRGPGVALHDGNNYVHRMRPTPTDPSVLSEPGFSASLTQEPDGSWTLVFADGGIWRFAALDGSPAQGKLLTSTDRVGKQVALTYDPLGRLTALTDNTGRALALTYNAQGRVETLVGPDGREVVYGYSVAGDLVSVRSPLVVGTPNGNDFPAGKVTQYTYSSGFPADELNHNLLSITNGEGQTWLTNEYGTGTQRTLRDRVKRQSVGASSNVIDYRYFAVSPSTSLSGEVVTAVVNDRMGNVHHHSHDGRNRPVRHEAFTGRAVANQPSTLRLNRPGAKLRPTDPDSFVTERFWNTDDREVLTVLPAGGSVSRTYEFDLDPQADPRARGNVRLRRRDPGFLGGAQASLEDRYTYAPGTSGCCGVEFVTSHVDPAGFETRHDYDGVGNRVRTTHPVSGVVEEWSYDGRGRVVSHRHAETQPQPRRVDIFDYLPEDGTAASGRLLRINMDSQGLALTHTYGYDAFGNEAVVTDPSGADTLTEFNALDQPVRVRTPETSPGAMDRGSATMSYDAADRLVSIEEPRVGADQPAPVVVRTQHTRDSLGRVMRTAVLEGGSILSDQRFEFDGNGQLARNRVQLASGASADETFTEYDERGLVLRSTQAPGTASETITAFGFDGHGQLSRRVVTGGGTTWNDDFFEVDGYGRRVQWTDAVRATQVFTSYDPRGLRISEHVLGQLAVDGDLSDVVPLKHHTYVYDEMRRLVRRSEEHFDIANGNPIGDGVAVTSFGYVGRGQLRSVTDDSGGVSRFEYDTAHRRVAAIDQKGDRVDYTLDSRGNSVVTTRTSFPDVGGVPETLVYRAEFDGRRRVVANVDPMGARSTFTYDSRGALTSSVDRNGNLEILLTDALGRELRTQQVMTDTGDGAGQEVSRIVRTRSYDRAGRLLTSTDANGNVVRFDYDVMGRVTSREHADGTVFTTTYLGPSILETRDANGTVIRRDYADGLLQARDVLQAGAGVVASNESFTMDGLGRLVAVSDDDTTVTFAYDSMGNVVRESLDVSVGPLSFVGQSACTHDGMGGVVSMTYPGGRELSYQLRHVGGRAEVMSISEGGLELVNFSYLGGRLQRRDVSLGQQGELVRSSYDFDARGWLQSELHAAGTQQVPLAALDHGYDASGNQIGYVEQLLGRSHTMGYDSADRLIRSSHPRGSGVTENVAYALDAQGNRLQVTGGSAAGTYGQDASLPAADAQVNQYTQTPGDSRSYSAAGNMIARTPLNGPQEVNTFDHAGRVVGRGGAGLTLRYDALGRLVHEQRAGSAGVAFFHLGRRMVEEERRLPFAGSATRIWVWGGGGAPVASRSASEGDAILLSSPNVGVLGSASGGAPFGTFGSLVERYDYEDHGCVLDAASGLAFQDSIVGNRYFFRGLRQDLASGDLVVGSSRIDPSVARSINRAGGIPDAPWSGDVSRAWLRASGAASAWPDDWTMPWLTGTTNNRPWRPTGITNNRPWKPTGITNNRPWRPTSGLSANVWPDDWEMPWLTGGVNSQAWERESSVTAWMPLVETQPTNLVSSLRRMSPFVGNAAGSLGASAEDYGAVADAGLGALLIAVYAAAAASCLQAVDSEFEFRIETCDKKAGKDCYKGYKSLAEAGCFSGTASVLIIMRAVKKCAPKCNSIDPGELAPDGEPREDDERSNW